METYKTCVETNKNCMEIFNNFNSGFMRHEAYLVGEIFRDRRTLSGEREKKKMRGVAVLVLSLVPSCLLEPVLCKQGKIKEVDNPIPIEISIQLLTSIQPQR